MNDSFVSKNPHHRNLVAKLRNSVADLNFYAFRFLTRAGFTSTPRTGIADINNFRGCILPVQLRQIESQYQKILNATPETADGLFYETWHFVHDFDHIFKK